MLVTMLVMTLVVFYFNARGLKSKIIELDYELSFLTKLPKVVFICETWLDSSNILGTDVFLLYDVFRKDRNKYGGGVIVMCYKFSMQPTL